MNVNTQENTVNNYPSFSDIHQPSSIEIPDAYVPSIQSSMAKVSIHIGEPSFTAKDTKAKTQVQNANGLSTSVVKNDKYLKELLVGFEPLRQLRTISGLARNTHYRLAFPWEKRGGFIIPTKDLTEYIEKISGFQVELGTWFDKFVDGYDDAVATDQAMRGGLFKISDYPKLYNPEDPTKQIMPTGKLLCPNRLGKFYIDFEVDEISDNFITRIAQEGVDLSLIHI